MSSTFFDRHGFKIVLITVFFMPFMLIGSIRALRSNRNEVKDWLPEDFRETAVHSWFQKHFPHEQFVLASWEGCTLDDPGWKDSVGPMRQRSSESWPRGSRRSRLPCSPAGACWINFSSAIRI